MIRRGSICTIALLLLLAGCVTQPTGPNYSIKTGELATTNDDKLAATIKPGMRPDLSTDDAGLRMMYDKAEASFSTSGTVVRDPALNKYMKDLVCKIAGPYCGDIRVYVIRAPYFNATMGPNGAMQVWTGLLLRVRNEAQLVTVLGHEIGHYLRQHSLQRMRNVTQTSNALAFFQLAAAGAGVGIVGNLGTIVAMAHLTAYGRDQEREADQFGHRFLVEHGYDPREASKVWQQLIEEQNAEITDDEESRSVFLSTHPLPDERQETLAALADKANPDGKLTNIGAEAFDAAVLPHRKLYLQDETNLRRFDRFEALLDMLIEDGKQVAELHYFRGELYRLRDDDTERALKAYLAAVKAGNPPEEVHRSLGQIYQARGQNGDAVAAYERYLSVKPDAEDAGIIRYLIGTLS